MTSPWWSKQGEAPTDEDHEPAPNAPPQSHRQPTPSHAEFDGDSIGEQIDSALGEFESRLTHLREALESKKDEITDIEAEIEAVEKEQAKAFKSLLSDSPAIKKILQTGGRRRPTRRRKTRRKSGR